MKKYLIDTQIGANNIYISEITIAELKYGIENSTKKKKNRQIIEKFINSIQIVPIIGGLDLYAKEKVKLKKMGRPVDNFDLLIGSSAIANNMILVSSYGYLFIVLNFNI